MCILFWSFCWLSFASLWFIIFLCCFTTLDISFCDWFFIFRFNIGLINCVKSWMNALILIWIKTNGLHRHWHYMLEHIRWLFWDWSLHNSLLLGKLVHCLLFLISDYQLFFYPLQWFCFMYILFELLSCRQGIQIHLESSLLNLVL